MVLIDYFLIKIFHILFFENFHFHQKNYYFLLIFFDKEFSEIIISKSLISKSNKVVEIKPDNNSSIILLSKLFLYLLF